MKIREAGGTKTLTAQAAGLRKFETLHAAAKPPWRVGPAPLSKSISLGGAECDVEPLWLRLQDPATLTPNGQRVIEIADRLDRRHLDQDYVLHGDGLAHNQVAQKLGSAQDVLGVLKRDRIKRHIDS